jgi:hypothetical protein
VRCLRRFHLRSLNDDPSACEPVVLAAVVEVEVGRDDRRDVARADAVPVERLVEVVVDRRVQLVDERVPDAHTGVDQDGSGGVQHEVGEHRERWPRPWQVRRGRDVGEVKSVDVDHGQLTHASATVHVARSCG